MNQQQATNYYEILEVASDAAPHEIHKAYQRARSTYSADNPALYSMFSPEEAREFMRLIEEAYSVLGNNILRKNYDDLLTRGEVPAPGQPMMPRPAPSPAAAAPVAAPSAAHVASQVASQHQALPDFPTPEAAANADFRKKDSFKNQLPPGMGRTNLSTYKIDEAFEAELKQMLEFDGAVLQRVRLYKSISLDQMSEATRISRPYLTAVETNDYKSLPAAVFVRGFVVQVARNLSLDENKVAASYMKRFKAGGGK